MLLVLDVGNTQTVIGIYESEAPDAVLLDTWRVATVVRRTSDELGLLLQDFLAFHEVSFDDDIKGIAISSGVPSVTSALREMSRRYFGLEALVIEPGIKTGLPILYDNPKEVGADRIANSVAAFDVYGGPTIVVDFGTATTFDLISHKGEYLGGAICPGIEIGLEALYGRASALQRVELVPPRNVVGKSTIEAIQSGTIYGYAGMVDAMCDRIEREIGEAEIVATGGLSPLIAPVSTRIAHEDPWLTLHGLRLVFARNQPRPTATES